MGSVPIYRRSRRRGHGDRVCAAWLLSARARDARLARARVARCAAEALLLDRILVRPRPLRGRRVVDLREHARHRRHAGAARGIRHAGVLRVSGALPGRRRLAPGAHPRRRCDARVPPHPRRLDARRVAALLDAHRLSLALARLRGGRLAAAGLCASRRGLRALLHYAGARRAHLAARGAPPARRVLADARARHGRGRGSAAPCRMELARERAAKRRPPAGEHRAVA